MRSEGDVAAAGNSSLKGGPIVSNHRDRLRLYISGVDQARVNRRSDYTPTRIYALKI